jgi:membrane-associated protease RseP (regulator of RpoE activity)
VFFVNTPRFAAASGPTGPLGAALGFTSALMGILLAHELGHVALAARHRFRVGFPLFLPAPFWTGTLGAILVPEEDPRDRRAQAEVGAAGPIAGFVAVVVTLLVWRGTGPVGPAADGPTLGVPLVFRLTMAGSGWDGVVSTQDPLALAAWIGCLVTALNLLPIGQLDGGHIVVGLFPDRAVWVGRLTTAVLLVAGLGWLGWAAWAALVHVVGAGRSVAPRSTAAPPGPARGYALGAVLVFALTFTPRPWG